MKNIIIMVTILITMSGCAVQKQWGSSGGSKSDGIVKLSYTYGPYDKVQIDNKKGLAKALKRCQAWGYDDVEAFDFVNSICQASNSYGCVRTLVTQELQCVNSNKKE